MRNLNFDIQAMSNIIGISEIEIKISLGLLSVKCEAKTAAEAKEAFDNAPDYSEAKEVALRRLIKLSLKEIKNAQTFSEAKKIFNLAPQDSRPEIMALKKMIELSNSIFEFKEIFIFSSGLKSKIAPLLLARWNIIFPKEINNITKFSEAENICLMLTDNSSRIPKTAMNIIALEKLIDLAATLFEIKEAFELTPKNSKIRRKALKKWEAIASLEIKAADNFLKLKELFYLIFPNSKEEDILLEKMIDLATNPDEIKDTLSLKTNSKIKNIALKKMVIFYKF